MHQHIAPPYCHEVHNAPKGLGEASSAVHALLCPIRRCSCSPRLALHKSLLKTPHCSQCLICMQLCAGKHQLRMSKAPSLRQRLSHHETLMQHALGSLSHGMQHLFIVDAFSSKKTSMWHTYACSMCAIPAQLPQMQMGRWHWPFWLESQQPIVSTRIHGLNDTC